MKAKRDKITGRFISRKGNKNAAEKGKEERRTQYKGTKANAPGMEHGKGKSSRAPGRTRGKTASSN